MSEPADQRGAAADAAGADAKRSVSGAAVSSPGVGLGSDPKAAAAAGAGPGARPAPAADVEGPEKPELYLAAAFAGAFLFARILKRIAE